MIYTIQMVNSSKTPASASVIVAGVLAILAGLITFLIMSLSLFGLLLSSAQGATPELPAFVRTATLGFLGFLLCLAAFGIATGIGLILLKNWARISVLIWGGFSVLFGVVGIPIILFISFPPTPGAPSLPATSLQMIRLFLAFMYGLPLIVGLWWLILFNRKSVKVQFKGSSTGLDPSVPQKPRCPVPVSVLAWFYVSSILNLLFLPFLSFRVPVFLFGRVLSGRVALTVLILSCLAFFVSGVGLLKLKPWSYSLTIGLQVFWLASTAVSVLSPNYSAVMDSFLKEMQASFHLPETQFSPANLARHYGWTVALGLLFAGAILGLLVYYRARFLEAASAVNSAS